MKAFAGVLQNTTKKTGCYLFKDASRNVIYVGKAKNIQKRIWQHFQSQNKNSKTSLMINTIREWETFITDNEKEAFILEHNLIKKYHPRFNIILTDSQTYPYILISVKDKDPQYFLTWKRIKKPGIYYGPFPNYYNAREMINLLKMLFPLRRCSKFVAKKPCFYYHLQQCSGACFQKVDPSYYQKQIRKIKLFFQGKVSKIKKQCQQKIVQAVKILHFEEAEKWKKLTEKIDEFVQKQKVEFNNNKNLDFINFVEEEEEIVIVIFFYQHGKLQLKKEGLFSLFNNNRQETIENFLQEIYTYHPLPEEIIAPREVNLKNWSKNCSVKLISPQTGKKKEILDLVKKNALILLKNKAVAAKQTDKIQILKDLAIKLKIKEENIKQIEFLDLSYFDEKLVVAGFTHYLNGFFLTRKNKIYQIKGVLHNEKEYFKKAITLHYQKNPLPKLIILDGSFLQLQGVKAGMELLKKDCHIICLVKNKKHQTEYILDSQGQRIQIKKTSKTWLFLNSIQTQGHEYVIKNLHYLRRKKARQKEE